MSRQHTDHSFSCPFPCIHDSKFPRFFFFFSPVGQIKCAQRCCSDLWKHFSAEEWSVTKGFYKNQFLRNIGPGPPSKQKTRQVSFATKAKLLVCAATVWVQDQVLVGVALFGGGTLWDWFWSLLGSCRERVWWANHDFQLLFLQPREILTAMAAPATSADQSHDRRKKSSFVRIFILMKKTSCGCRMHQIWTKAIRA